MVKHLVWGLGFWKMGWVPVDVSKFGFFFTEKPRCWMMLEEEVWARGASGKGSQGVKSHVDHKSPLRLDNSSCIKYTSMLGLHVSPVKHDLGSRETPPKIPAFASCPSDVPTKRI